VIAQLGAPDMRTPIACALAWPERIDAGVEPVDFARLAGLSFEALDPARFPCVGLAYAALRAGGTAPATLNAANETAVEAFLSGRLGFDAIPGVIEAVLGEAGVEPLQNLDQLAVADNEARALASRMIARAARPATTGTGP
jgi:1-deoxy-D-xylulose-5-phosphate reductoisomerase